MQSPKLIFIIRKILCCIAILIIAIVLNLIWSLSFNNIDQVFTDTQIIFFPFTQRTFLMNIEWTRKYCISHFLIFCQIKDLLVNLLFLKYLNLFTGELNQIEFAWNAFNRYNYQGNLLLVIEKLLYFRNLIDEFIVLIHVNLLNRRETRELPINDHCFFFIVEYSIDLFL